ncbi:hypothetical protein [Leucobacter sp. wl10]|uniref:hypothetical protein n=1 Tax=Leucobacter sp. wl10 TaxID=2304677 RepID=UPI0013C36117|nr:hypothetical protein [Leucobacter sp. wl10]
MNVLNIAVRVAEKTKFDPNTVTPGVAGFVFTAILAAGIIVLGFLLVRRLRRSAYRAEARARIADELAGGRSATDEPGEEPDSSPSPDSPARPDARD